MCQELYLKWELNFLNTEHFTLTMYANSKLAFLEIELEMEYWDSKDIQLHKKIRETKKTK